MSDFSNTIEQIKNRISITDVIQPSVSLKKEGNRLKGLCPFHKEKSPSFHVDATKGTYYCFGCGKHGDHFSFLTDHSGMTFLEALNSLADRAGVIVPQANPNYMTDASVSEKISENQISKDILEHATKWYQSKLSEPKSQFVRDYLQNRGVNNLMAERFCLGFSPEYDSLKQHLLKLGYDTKNLVDVGLITETGYDRFKGRLMFPIWDAKGKVIAFGGRALQKDQMPKYLNSADTALFHKSLILYAQHLAFQNINKDTPPLVVEGYMDVLTLHQYGFTTAIAPLGTALSDDHLKKLWQRHSSPLFCFDGDEAGKKAAFRVAQKVFPLLKPHFSVQFCFLPNGEDPDSFLKNNNSENFREILKTSQNLADTLFQGYLEQYSISEKASAEDKTKLKKSLFDHIEKIADTDLKQFFRNDINNKIYEYFRISPNKTKFSNKNNGFLRTELLQSVKNIKKKYLAEKILLATLKNNPTLIERVYEPLMSMDGLPNDLLGFKNFLCEHTFADSKSLQAKAIELGFETVLQQLNTINLSAMASFGMTGADEDLAYKGWKDIWNHCYLKTELQNESTKMKMNLRQKLDDTSWAKWQQLKISIAIDTDEQEIQNTEIKTIRS